VPSIGSHHQENPFPAGVNLWRDKKTQSFFLSFEKGQLEAKNAHFVVFTTIKPSLIQEPFL
jgi:hypothetical protein